MSTRQSASKPEQTSPQKNDASLPAVSHSVNNDLTFFELLVWNLRASRLRSVLWALIVAAPAALVLYLVSGSALLGGIAYGAAAIVGMMIYTMWRGYYANLYRMKNITTTITPGYLSSKLANASRELRFDWTRVRAVRNLRGMIVYEIDNEPGNAICISSRCFKTKDEAADFYRNSMEYWKHGQVRRHALGLCVVDEEQSRLPHRTALFITLGSIVLLITTMMLSDFHAMSRMLFWVLLACAGVSFPILRGLGQTPQQYAVPASSALARENDPRRALAIAQRGLNRFPSHPELCTVAAFASYRLDDIDRGLLYVEGGLNRDPRHASLLAARAFGLRENCQPERALADLYASSELDPYIFWSTSLRAGVLLDLSRYKEAIKVAAEAAELDQRNTAPALMTAYGHAMMNDIPKAFLAAGFAEAILAEGGLSARERAIILSTCAAVYTQANKLDLATDCARRAIDADSTFVGGHSELGHVFCLQNNSKAADSAFEHAYRLEMTKRQRVGLVLNMSLSAVLFNKPAVADELTNNALNTVRNTFTLTYRALSYLALGGAEEALPLLDEAIRIDPYNRLAYWVRHRARASALGYTEDGVRDLQIALDFGFRPFL